LLSLFSEQKLCYKKNIKSPYNSFFLIFKVLNSKQVILLMVIQQLFSYLLLMMKS